MEVAADPRAGVAMVAGERRIIHVLRDGVPRTIASLERPTALAYDGAGNVPGSDLYVADFGNNRVDRIGANGAVSTVPTGIGPNSVAVDRAGVST